MSTYLREGDRTADHTEHQLAHHWAICCGCSGPVFILSCSCGLENTYHIPDAFEHRRD